MLHFCTCLGEVVPKTSICSLKKTAINAVRCLVCSIVVFRTVYNET